MPFVIRVIFSYITCWYNNYLVKDNKIYLITYIENARFIIKMNFKHQETLKTQLKNKFQSFNVYWSPCWIFGLIFPLSVQSRRIPHHSRISKVSCAAVQTAHQNRTNHKWYICNYEYQANYELFILLEQLIKYRIIFGKCN